jgi:hypothetical protein
MNTKYLLEKNKYFQEKANDLLAKTSIENVLSKYGEFSFQGSYSYGLMMSGDIDMYVISENITRDKALDIFNEIVKSVPVFYGYKFNDFVSHPGWEGIPRGYCFNLSLRDNGEKWKMDIWLLQKTEFDKLENYKQLIKEKLNDANKLTILDIKNYREENKLKISSVKIYDAVLKDGISSIFEYKEKY